MFAYGREDIMHDENPTDEVWSCFYEYLVFVKTRIQNIRKRFLFDSDDAIQINNQKSVRALFVIRNKNNNIVVNDTDQ